MTQYENGHKFIIRLMICTNLYVYYSDNILTDKRKGKFMATTKETMTLAVEIGDQMLRNGAEIYRVEDTIIHILEAYQIDDFDVYVLSNGIFASADNDRDGACSIIRHIPLGAVNLGKIAILNQLARDICEKNCSIENAWDTLEKCNTLPSYPQWLQMLSCGIGSAGFCFLFGGHVIDTVFAFFIGFLEQIMLMLCKKYKISRFITTLFASLFVTALSFLVLFTGIDIMQDKIIIGSIMPLVPGMAFTTSIRDFYNGDYLSGTIHLVDALITAVCIATGACLPLFIYQM